MAQANKSLGAISISFYFLLNLFVTITSKELAPQLQSAWLLTASHAIATFIVTTIVYWLREDGPTRQIPCTTPTGSKYGTAEKAEKVREDGEFAFSKREHFLRNLYILLPFALLYTFNIVVSNWTLGLVSLNIHQTIRAIVPAITVAISIVVSGRSWRQYSSGLYGAITLTICGVIWAVNTASTTRNASKSSALETNISGFAWTLMGAVLAVLKTMASKQLQERPRENRWGLGLSSSSMVRFCALCAICLTIPIAALNGDMERLAIKVRSAASLTELSWSWLWFTNALAASMLNIASFEAVKRCGPLTMGIAGNLKQVVILLLDVNSYSDADVQSSQQKGDGVVLGSLMTVVGGIWYGFAKADMDKQVQEYSVEDGLSAGKQG